MHAEPILVFHGDAAGIDQFGAALGVGVCGRNDLHRAAVVHAEPPLRDVEVMRAPVAHPAAAVFLIVAPRRGNPYARRAG